MRKKSKLLANNLQKLFNSKVIQKMALKYQFVKRKSKLTGEIFFNLCTFYGDELCSASLTNLCNRLAAKEGIVISQQALDNRFNKNSCNFLRNALSEMMKIQNTVLKEEEVFLKTIFNRIMVADSTSFKLPDTYKNIYKGVGTEAGAKIQLQFNLLNGEFSLCEMMRGNKNDSKYLSTLEDTLKEGDLCLRDLGYFKIDDLILTESKGAYYISKLKSNMNIFKKEEVKELGTKGNLIIRERYSPIDIYELVEPLAEGETLELIDIYIGSTYKKKLKTRLIVTKLTGEDKKKRQNKQKKEVGKNRRVESELNNKWAGINVYITNISADVIDALKIHELYSLRWQVELMFKIWKSHFKIHMVKKTKIERFECFLYGRLISILLASCIVFTFRRTIYLEKGKEISEIKAFEIVKEHFELLRKKFFQGEILISKVLLTIFNVVSKIGLKCRKKGKKTPAMILKEIEITEGHMAKMVS